MGHVAVVVIVGGDVHNGNLEVAALACMSLSHNHPSMPSITTLFVMFMKNHTTKMFVDELLSAVAMPEGRGSVKGREFLWHHQGESS